MTVKELIIELQKYPVTCEVNINYETFAFRGIKVVRPEYRKLNGRTIQIVLLEEET